MNNRIVNQRLATLILYDVYSDEGLVGKGYSIWDAIDGLSGPILQSLNGESLEPRWFRISVTDNYIVVINDLVH